MSPRYRQCPDEARGPSHRSGTRSLHDECKCGAHQLGLLERSNSELIGMSGSVDEKLWPPTTTRWPKEWLDFIHRSASIRRGSCCRSQWIKENGAGARQTAVAVETKLKITTRGPRLSYQPFWYSVALSTASKLLIMQSFIKRNGDAMEVRRPVEADAPYVGWK